MSFECGPSVEYAGRGTEMVCLSYSSYRVPLLGGAEMWSVRLSAPLLVVIGLGVT